MKKLTGRFLETEYGYIFTAPMCGLWQWFFSNSFQPWGSFLQTKTCSAARYSQQMKKELFWSNFEVLNLPPSPLGSSKPDLRDTVVKQDLCLFPAPGGHIWIHFGQRSISPNFQELRKQEADTTPVWEGRA